MDAATQQGTSSPRLGLLSSIRLAGNGVFRFLYPFLPVVAPALGLADGQSGLLVAALAFGGVMTPVVRRKLVGGAERPRRLLGYAAVLVGIGALATSLAPFAALALAALFLMGAGKPLIDAAAISYVSARTKFAARARATATMELTWAGGLIVVAPIAGLIAGVSSWRVPFAMLGAAILVLGLVASRSLDADPPAPDGLESPGLWATFRGLSDAGTGYLWVVAFSFAALEATFSAFGLWLDRVHGIPLEQLGGFAALVAIGELSGAAFVTFAADKLGKSRTLLAGLSVCIVGLTAFALAPNLALSIGALGVGLVGSEVAIVAAIAIASEVEPGARTRYLAVLFAVTSFTRAIVGGVGPALFTAVGITGNVVISIACAAIASLLVRRLVRSHPRLGE